MARNFHLYGKVTERNPHLKGENVEFATITAEEMARITAGQSVFVETGIFDGQLWHDEGVTKEMMKQFFADSPEAKHTGRFWWIPLDGDDAVIVPIGQGNYQLHTLRA